MVCVKVTKYTHSQFLNSHHLIVVTGYTGTLALFNALRQLHSGSAVPQTMAKGNWTLSHSFDTISRDSVDHLHTVSASTCSFSASNMLPGQEENGREQTSSRRCRPENSLGWEELNKLYAPCEFIQQHGFDDSWADCLSSAGPIIDKK